MFRKIDFLKILLTQTLWHTLRVCKNVRTSSGSLSFTFLYPVSSLHPVTSPIIITVNYSNMSVTADIKDDERISYSVNNIMLILTPLAQWRPICLARLTI